MKIRSSWRHSVAAVFVACACSPALLFAGEPMEAVRSTSEQAMEILKDPSLKGQDKAGQRRDKLREVIYPRFDFTEMARRSLGSHWRRRTPEEQAEYLKLFTDLIEKSYIDKIESYSGEKVQYGKERAEKTFAEVDTHVVSDKGEKFALNYKLHSTGGDWKVYDVVIENISLVNNYRSQFDRILSKSSFDDLLTRLKAKQFQPAAVKSKT